MKQRKRTAGDGQPQQEDAEALELVSHGTGAAADAECEPAVGGGVADRGQRQGQEVGRLRARRTAAA